MQSLSMSSMGFHWQTGLLRATHAGTFHAFTTIKEKEKACLLLFLIPSNTCIQIFPTNSLTLPQGLFYLLFSLTGIFLPYIPE